MLCFIAETRECLHNWFRAGSAYTSNGAVEFLKECYERIPQRVAQLFVRADSGFSDGDLLDFLESRQSEYLIKVKMRNLVEMLMSQTSWQREKGKTGIETVVFLHQCHGWKKARRFVAIRKLVAVQTEGVFFPMPQYEFFCYVTNLPMLPGIFISYMVREPPVRTGSPCARVRWLPAPSAPAPSGPIPPSSRAASWRTT